MGNINDIFELANAVYGREELRAVTSLTDEELEMNHLSDIDEIVQHIEVPKEYIYYTGNFMRPLLAWDGKYATLEIPFGGGKFEPLKGAWKTIEKRIDTLVEEGSYHRVFARMSELIKADVYTDVMDELPRGVAYSLFKEIYAHMEYHFDLFDWDKVKALCYEHNKEDKEALEKEKGKTVTIYRGIASKSDEQGLSWTTDKKIAVFFANRFQSQGYILEGKVLVEDILTAIDREEEILVERDRIQDIKIL